jgi:hypothetical protein
MRPVVISIVMLFSLAAQETSRCGILRKQVQDAAKKRQSIPVCQRAYRRSHARWPVTEVLSEAAHPRGLGCRETNPLVQNPGKARVELT